MLRQVQKEEDKHGEKLEGRDDMEMLKGNAIEEGSKKDKNTMDMGKKKAGHADSQEAEEQEKIQ